MMIKQLKTTFSKEEHFEHSVYYVVSIKTEKKKNC